MQADIEKGRNPVERVLNVSLTSTAAFLLAVWAQAMFFAANKPGATILIAFGLVFMVLMPWLLLKRGRINASIYVFLVSAVLVVLTLFWLGRGVLWAGTIVQLAVMVHAAVLLGRKGVYWTAGVCLSVDLLKTVLESMDYAAPLYFPGTLAAGWFFVALTIAWVAPVVLHVTNALHRSADQMRAQLEELRKSKQLLQSIAETAPIGIVVFDAQGICIFANSFAKTRLGEDLIGCRCEDLPPMMDFNGDVVPPEQRPFARVSSGECGVYGARAMVERPPGRFVYLSVSAATLPNGPRGNGVVVTFEDVTAHVDSDRKHLQSQRLASMGQLAGWVAHDFNNFLTVIRGDSQLALAKAPEDSSLRTRLERIYQTSERAAAVCKRLLTFARLEDAITHPLSLTELVTENVDMLRGLLPANVNLALKLEADLRLISGDTSLLTQVLMNLVVNGRDAMPNGGTITISTANDSPRAGVLMFVEDSGTGINLATLPSIFEPRFTTKAEGRGTGLGLAIVYGVVEQFGGWIRVESEPGKGARFLIRFPAAESKSSAA